MGAGSPLEGCEPSQPIKMNWKASRDFATLKSDTESADGSPVSSRKAEDLSGLSATDRFPEGHRTVRESLFGFPDSRRLSLFWPPDRPHPIIFNRIFPSFKDDSGASWLRKTEEWRCRSRSMFRRFRGTPRTFVPSYEPFRKSRIARRSVRSRRTSCSASKDPQGESRPR